MRNLELKELEGIALVDATAMFSGYGHYRIKYEFQYKGENKEFTRTTDNMPIIDDWKDEDDLDEKIDILAELISPRIEVDLYEWKLEVDELKTVTIKNK